MIDLITNDVRNFKKFKQFKNFIKEQDETKHEKIVKFSDWELTEDGLRIEKKVHPMRDSAMKTLLKTFTMPIKFYYSKSPTDMLIKDVNRMRDEYTEDSEILVHFQENEVRAVSKPTFQKVRSSLDIINGSMFGDSVFQAASYDDYGIRLTTVNKKEEIKVAKDDIMNTGSDIVYSDIGFTPTA
jgi:hypothetical protein